MRQCALNYINQYILNQVKGLEYIVKADAPQTEMALFNESTLVIWNGGSENTVYQDETINWAFRAWHDSLHLKTRMNFSPQSEIELGRIQASHCGSSLVADLIYIEVSLQACYYLNTGLYIDNQLDWTLKQLKLRGIK